MRLNVNKVIRILITSDFLLQSGWGLIGPIFAIFLTQQIRGGSLAMVGLAVAVYWLGKSIVQPFIAHSFDTEKGEKDDFYFLFGGMLVANLVPLGYLISSEIWHIFLLEFVRAMAMACVVPTWSAIFTRHIDKGWEAFSWSLESTAIGFAAGFAAAFGGIIATILGFRIIFVLVSLFGLSSTFVLLFIRDKLYSRDHFMPRIPPKEELF